MSMSRRLGLGWKGHHFGGRQKVEAETDRFETVVVVPVQERGPGRPHHS